ncbi:MAG TPA: VOC family protein [Acidobacteriaceae bacterium]|jgi:catechol 2,3-dioxygenase-like lactoylglutathione lyase family enzyme
MSERTVQYGGCSPVLRVENIARSLRFYVDILGFENVEWGTDDFTRINRGKSCIFLCRQAQGAGRAWMWVGIDDTARLHEELAAQGVAIRLPPTNFFYALEMHVEDPDGNVLRFGSDPLTDRPFEELRFRED